MSWRQFLQAQAATMLETGLLSERIRRRPVLGGLINMAAGSNANDRPRVQHLTTQDGEFVAEDQDLGVLRRLAAAEQLQPAKDPGAGEVQESHRAQAVILPHQSQRTKPQVTATASSSGAVQAREVSASGPERLFGAQGGGGLGRGGPAGGPECADSGDAQSGQGQQQEVGDTQDVHKAAGQHYAAEAGRRR
jgi:hypothetical protein